MIIAKSKCNLLCLIKVHVGLHHRARIYYVYTTYILRIYYVYTYIPDFLTNLPDTFFGILGAYMSCPEEDLDQGGRFLLR